jgi:hypothetical protein
MRRLNEDQTWTSVKPNKIWSRRSEIERRTAFEKLTIRTMRADANNNIRAEECHRISPGRARH